MNTEAVLLGVINLLLILAIKRSLLNVLLMLLIGDNIIRWYKKLNNNSKLQPCPVLTVPTW